MKDLSKKHSQKRDIVQRTFSKLILDNVSSKSIQIFDQFKNNLKEGINIKNKLIYNLVTANKMKQAEIIYILKTRAEHLR